MKLKYLLVFLLTVGTLEAQLLGNIKDWWSSFRTYETTEPPRRGEKISVVKYGEWTSAPSAPGVTRPTTTRSTTTPATTRADIPQLPVDGSVKVGVFLTTPSPSHSRNIGVRNKLRAAWETTTESGRTSTGSLFDLLSPGSETNTRELARKTTRSTSTETVLATTRTTQRSPSLFDITEIFFQNFSTPAPVATLVTEDLQPLLETKKHHLSMKDRLPGLPEKFREVLKNHTQPQSLFSDDSWVDDATVVVSSTEETQKNGSDNMFRVSRQNGTVDPSLIIHTSSRIQNDEKTEVVPERKSRFGLSRPKIKELFLTEVERSSNPIPSSIKSLKKHKYKFLKQKAKKDLKIEEILEASSTRKRFDLSGGLKPKTPIYVKKNLGISNFRPEKKLHDVRRTRNIEEPESAWERILPAFPFKTGKIFDSKTGEIRHFELGRSIKQTNQNAADEEVIGNTEEEYFDEDNADIDADEEYNPEEGENSHDDESEIDYTDEDNDSEEDSDDDESDIDVSHQDNKPESDIDNLHGDNDSELNNSDEDDVDVVIEDNYFKDESNAETDKEEIVENSTDIPEESESRSLLTEEEMIADDNLTLSVDVSDVVVNDDTTVDVSTEEPELVKVVDRLPGPLYLAQPQPPYFRIPSYRVVFPPRPRPFLYPQLPRLTGYQPRINYLARNIFY